MMKPLTLDEIWRPLRKSVNPAFSQKAILSLQPKMDKHSSNLLNEILTFLNKGEFDIRIPLGKFSVGQIFGIYDLALP